MDEVLWPTAHLPDSFVRLPPERRQVLENERLHRAAAFRHHHASPDSLVEGVADLAKDIELELRGSGVPDANWRRVLVADQPRNDQLRQPLLPADSIHDLN